MGITDIADGNVAAQYYVDANYDINRAAQRYFDGATGGMNQTPNAMYEDYGGAADYGNIQEPPRNQRNQGSELHILYKKHLQRKEREEEEKGMSESFKETASTIGGGFRGIWNYIMPIALRGETEGGEEFIVYFRKNYEDLSRFVKFNSGTFERNIWHATQVKKPLLVYLHTDSPVFRPIPQRLFRDAQLVEFMTNNFHFLGLLANTESSQKVLKYIHTKHCPCLAVFRRNLLDETILVEFITLTTESTAGQILNQLKNSERSYYSVITEEERIKRDVVRSLNNSRRRDLMMNSPFYAQDMEGGMFAMQNMQQPRPRAQPRPEDLQRIEEARILRQIQDEEYKEAERKILEQQEKKIEEEKLRKEKEAQEEILRRQKEEEELRKQEEARKREEEKENLKKNKLATLPVEPAEGEAGIISIVFRLPDGNRGERRFYHNDKVQILYDYIDTRDIQFDPTTVRYDLMQPRPFLCLDDKEKTLNDYFEGSDHEVIVVRELTE